MRLSAAGDGDTSSGLRLQWHCGCCFDFCRPSIGGVMDFSDIRKIKEYLSLPALSTKPERILAKAEGIKVEMFVVADDKALDVTDKAVGHRGLCGALMIHKIAGAMAESANSLEEIVSTLTRVSKGLATIGLSLSSCSLPGRGPTFHLNENEMELGLGIHGEAGVKRLPLASARDAVEIMIDHLSRKFEVGGDESTFGIIVNNLGGLSCLEVNVVVKEVVSLLRSRGAVVARVFTGSLMTSLEMAGVSITLLRVDNDLLKLLDEPTKAAAWPTIFNGQSSFCKCHEDSNIFVEDSSSSSSVTTSENSRAVDAAKLNDKNTALVKVAIEKVCATLIDNEEKLNALDSESGDGDCGTTHSRMAKAILAARPNLSHSCPSALLGQLAHLAQEAMGGTSGAVYSLGLMAGSKSLEAMVNVDAWARALDAAMAAVTFYGKADIGDRTLLDAFHPILAVLRKNELRSLQEILDVASAAAMEGAMATKDMVAKAGRATYVARDRQDQPDPGAFAVFLWIQAVAEASRSLV